MQLHFLLLLPLIFFLFFLILLPLLHLTILPFLVAPFVLLSRFYSSSLCLLDS